jgi:FAD/FMN-containing dehydrogenase
MITTDDISGLNKTTIKQILYPSTTEDCIKIIRHAIKNNLQIISRGAAHSMGAQTLISNGLIIDTRNMNQIINLDAQNFLLTVQPGILWSDVIYYLNNYGFSPITLQSYSSFSVGGSISVNAHGITSDRTLADSIKCIEIVNGDMTIIRCDRNMNGELFSLILGGYGLFGIITTVTIKIIPNVKLDTVMLKLNTYNFNKVYQKVLLDKTVSVKFARINVTNMNDITLYVFKKIKDTQYNNELMSDNPNQMSKINQLIYKWMLPNPGIQKMRYYFESFVSGPLDANTNNSLTRNQLVYESADALANLYEPIFKLNKTHVLQEYFIPTRQFVNWLIYLRYMFIDSNILRTYIFNKYSLLNITIRYVKKDNTSFLAYAHEDVYAFVFYYRIEKTDSLDNYLHFIHDNLANYAIYLGGSFYLPYRHHYDLRQLNIAYPNIENFVLLKEKYDPRFIFNSQWFIMIRKLLDSR